MAFKAENVSSVTGMIFIYQMTEVQKEYWKYHVRILSYLEFGWDLNIEWQKSLAAIFARFKQVRFHCFRDQQQHDTRSF